MGIEIVLRIVMKFKLDKYSIKWLVCRLNYNIPDNNMIL